MKKPWVNQNACVSCGLCITNIPEVFRFTDHGKAAVYDAGGAHNNTIQQEAIDICLVSSIYWLE